MNFAVVDFIFAAIVLITTIAGFAKGFVENVLNKLGWVVAVILSGLFYEQMAVVLAPHIPNLFLAKLAGFFLIFAIVFLVIMILKLVLSKLFSGTVLGGLDRALGGLFGIVEGIAIVFIIIFLLNLQPFFNVAPLFSESFFSSLMYSVTSQF